MVELRSEFEAQVLEWPDVTSKYMFGCLAYLARGKMFVFINEEDLVINNLDSTSRQAIAETHEAFPFESKGKPVGGWMQVSVNDEAELSEIIDFVRTSYEAALRKSREA